MQQNHFCQDRRLVREGAMFKKIKALIDPLHLDDIKEALEGLNIQGVTISNCRNVIPRKGPATIFRGRTQATDFLSEIWLEMVVDEDLAGKVIETIQNADGAGRDMDGKISVLSIEEVLSIEASECGRHRDLGVGT
jgi:nitrogen regulatory protein P-II 1